MALAVLGSPESAAPARHMVHMAYLGWTGVWEDPVRYGVGQGEEGILRAYRNRGRDGG